ncbi:hypothetical protein LTR40_008586, partial [Exophiala xenobiotica]
MSPPDPPSDQSPEALVIPQVILQEAAAAAAANQEDSGAVKDNKVPKPAYNAAQYGQLDISQNGFDTSAQIGSNGRINIKINQRSKKLTNLLIPALRHQLELQRQKASAEPQIPEGLGETDGLPPPPLNIVIQIVGSRGDVQPFIALGQVLKNKYNHRVRIATHPTFKEFVTENGLEFFSIGGDPAELMAFMVKNPGLMPGMDSLKSGDVGKRRKGIYEIVTGCWRSTIEAGDGTGAQVSDDTHSFDSSVSFGVDPTLNPFVADAIIANPPSFAHVHIAEKLGIPLHLMFTMPWSPTQAFPHPLANIVSSNTDANMANFVTYALVDMLTWQGLGDVINRFRERSLGLEPRANELSMKIKSEKGTDTGAESFHKQLHLSDLRCSLAPKRAAVWRVKRTDIRLSPLAAVVLSSEGLLDFSDLKLYRPREYETEDGPWEPISGGAAALMGTIGNLSMGIADFPVEILKSLKTASGDLKELHERTHSPSGTSTPAAPSERTSTEDTTSPADAASSGPSSGAASSAATQSGQEIPSLSSRPSAMSGVLSADGHTRSPSHHRQGSHHSRHSRSQSGSRGPHHRERSPACEEVGQISLDTAISGARAVGTIVSAGVKSPMDFTLSLAKGFHNAPKLYGDDTVRKSEKIVDLQSGLKAAGREFGYGFYDGITGLVTQPLAGAKKEGIAGFFKGAAKGIGGVVLKPGAGIWGLPGYTAK